MRANRSATRVDPRAAVKRDRRRLARRDPRHQSFWRSLNVLGMVGWPIVIGSLGGIFLGRYLDNLLQSGIRFTLMLLMLGVSIGSFVAWKTVVQKHD